MLLEITYLFTHRCHVFSPDSPSLGVADKKAQRIIFSDNENERVGDTAISDFGALSHSIHILNALALRTI